jgi:hypothetical protein
MVEDTVSWFDLERDESIRIVGTIDKQIRVDVIEGSDQVFIV